MTKYVFSTLPAANQYTVYTKDGNGMPVPDKSITIKGGAGVADRRGDTPLGVMTELTDAEYDLIKDNAAFRRHVERKFIIVSSEKLDAENVAADQNRESPDKPVTDDELAAENVKATTSGKKK